MCNELGLEYTHFSAGIKYIMKYNLNFSELLVRLQVLINLAYTNTEINSKNSSPYIILINVISDSFNESVFDLGYAIKENKNKPALIYKKGVSFLDEKVVLMF